MAESYIGQLKTWGCNFAPRAFTFAQGQLLPIAQHTALFSLYGTIYGGDGRVTFALPNLSTPSGAQVGRAAMGEGTGPGLSHRALGAQVGSPTVTLVTNQIPSHTHTVNVASSGNNSQDPAGNLPGALPTGYATSSNSQMGTTAVTNTGLGGPHNNMMPYLGINFTVCLEGLYPSRT